MNERTEFQFIVGPDGKPAYVVVPYKQFKALTGCSRPAGVPNAVVNLVFENGLSAIAAWREHLGLTQAAVAERIGITQVAYARMERAKRPRQATLEKVADALGPHAEQLRW